MRVKILRIFFISLCLMAFTAAASAASFVVVPPGELFTSGSGITGAPLPQVAGVPFNVTVVSVTGNTLVNTSGSVSMTAVPGTTGISPYNFILTQYPGGTNGCFYYPVVVTIGTGVTGNITMTASDRNLSGILSGSVTITSQVLDHYAFTAISSPQAAGVAIQVTITAQNTANATISNFNGTATLTANYPVIGAVSLGTITFINGVYKGLVTLYDASNANVTLTCASAVPVVSNTSAGFAVSPGALNKLLIIGPGQTWAPGTTSPSGRVGASTQTSQQTAGSNFSITVYACDQYWNTITAASTITMSTSDTNYVFTPPSQATTDGAATFTVQLRTVDGGAQAITATAAGATLSTDTVPLTFNTLDHFIFNNVVGSQTAGAGFNLTNIAAVDAYNNTVTTYNSGASISAFIGTPPSGTAFSASNWAHTSVSFSAGVGHVNTVNIFQRVFSMYLAISNVSPAAVGYSNAFDVAAGDFTKLLLVAPGQSYNPGNSVNGGVAGTPSTATAGTPISIDVYATDDYGNLVNTITDTLQITSTDSAATANGVTLPVNIALSGGQKTFNFVFFTGGSRTITISDLTNGGITPGNDTIFVVASTLDHFEVANLPSGSATAGVAFNPIVRAKDQYNNTLANYTGTVYLSCNTDWLLPNETTISITSGSNAGASSYKWAVTITAGNLGERTDLTGTFYRATSGNLITPTAQLFASDIFADTPTNHTGHYGLSSSVTVTANTATSLQVIPPGVQARPGTTDGENGTPTGQIVSAAFTATVNVTDNWFNVVPGRTDEIGITTQDPPFSLINSDASLPKSVWVVNGTANFTVQYSKQTSAFYITAADIGYPSVTSDNSPIISIYQIFSISITAPGGGNIGPQQVATPFAISITAYSAPLTVANGFNGVVNLGSNTNWSDDEYCISDRVSLTFTAGVCVMPISMYRSFTQATTGQYAVLIAKLGSQTWQSNTFDVKWGTVANVVVLAEGMGLKAGLNYVGIPAYDGTDGKIPTTVEAGVGHRLEVVYVDTWYNRVFDLPATTCTLTSTDPQASVDGTPLSTSVNINLGDFLTLSGFILRNVGVDAWQKVTAHPGGSLANNTTPQINIRHTTFDHFGVIAPAGPVMAGVPFNVTIYALDAWQNVCDARNGGDPHIPNSTTPNDTAILSPAGGLGSNTLLPVSWPISNGFALASIQLFQAPLSTAQITASCAGITGTSANIETVPNEFKRLLVTTSGMARRNGVYTSGNTSEFLMYDPLRPPFYPSNSTTVNDAAHSPAGTSFNIYACDAYGNITATADVNSQTITVTTNDVYAIPVTQTTIDGSTGQVPVNVVFHTATSGLWVRADITNPQIESFTTPDFHTSAGSPYGLQVLVPGLTVDAGSGTTDSVSWFSGVIGTPQTELSSVHFAVTVQACDVYGNFTNSVVDTIRVTSSIPAGTSFPTSGGSSIFTGTLGSPDPGTSTLNAHLDVSSSQYVVMSVTDISDPVKNRIQTFPSIYVTLGGTLIFEVLAKNNTSTAYTPYGDGSTAYMIHATAAPATFGFRINLVDSVSNQPVFGATNLFNLAPVSASDFNVVLPGTLGIATGSVTNGVFESTNQSYTGAGRFRIRVTDPNGIIGAKYSPIIDLSANSANAIFTLSPAYQNARANTNVRLSGTLVDGNGNPITDVPITFQIVQVPGRDQGNTAFTNGLQSITAVTDHTTGIADVFFVGDYIDQSYTIQGIYGSVSYTPTATIAISLVDPVLGTVSSYPNPFIPGSDPITMSHITYMLDANSDVKIRIYSLFGDLVFSKDIASGQHGALGGVVNTFVWDGKNSKGELIGRGGYICSVEAVIQGTKRKMIRKIAAER